ncbi:hypothetical protein FJQ87_17745 [Shewanella sp. SNU WT4]|uniref:conjugal transfer protein TraF n=1 Tax=Shewanella sp. SNU WT4 TaxID=2590015 RepID=UPI00112DF804|nr:conjugal transfer protein TraF [Shewanella sp. SNU WT4]QDF68274.1 hypothetical protein FJQ87_17745 [Shewanella sp. SNU WT4]
MMKTNQGWLLFTTACLSGISASAFAGQANIDARALAMGGVAVASSQQAASVFYNPALLAKPSSRKDDIDLLLPSVMATFSDRDDLQSGFDQVQQSYDGLNQAINNADEAQIDVYRQQLITNLEQLAGDSGYVNAAIGAAVAMPSWRIPAAVFYQTYVEGMGIADVTQRDLDVLAALDPSNPPDTRSLTSSGTAVAGAVSELGVALSYPLSIVNMPVTVGVSPKIQRLDSFNYVASANNFENDDISDDKYRSNATHFNLDVGMTIMPLHNLTFGLSARDLISHSLDSLAIDGQSFSFNVEPKYTLGVAWDWQRLMLSSDIDLNKDKPFEAMPASQYWRMGGELKATDWLSLRLGYRYDIETSHDDIYTIGSGVSIGDVFSIDLAGMIGSGDSLGAALQTRYQF